MVVPSFVPVPILCKEPTGEDVMRLDAKYWNLVVQTEVHMQERLERAMDEVTNLLMYCYCMVTYVTVRLPYGYCMFLYWHLVLRRCSYAGEARAGCGTTPLHGNVPGHSTAMYCTLRENSKSKRS
eukprot:2147987-Pyramimonas_sp.AAC.2